MEKFDFKRWGIFLMIAGVAAFLLPFFGYQLLLFRVVPITDPLVAGGLALAGIVLFVIGLRQQPTQNK